MLVLSRKPGEIIRLGDDIEVTVCEIRGNRVRLAISAPLDVPIRRAELDLRSPLAYRAETEQLAGVVLEPTA